MWNLGPEGGRVSGLHNNVGPTPPPWVGGGLGSLGFCRNAPKNTLHNWKIKGFPPHKSQKLACGTKTPKFYQEKIPKQRDFVLDFLESMRLSVGGGSGSSCELEDWVKGVGCGVNLEMVDPPPPEMGLVKTSRFLPPATPLQNHLPTSAPARNRTRNRSAISPTPCRLDHGYRTDNKKLRK